METVFIHNVYFYLKSSLSAEELRSFERSLQTLQTVSYVLYGKVGKPAGTSREVVDASYDYSLLLVFQNKEDHDRYQNHEPIHHLFIETCRPYWEKVVVFDSLTF